MGPTIQTIIRDIRTFQDVLNDDGIDDIELVRTRASELRNELPAAGDKPIQESLNKEQVSLLKDLLVHLEPFDNRSVWLKGWAAEKHPGDSHRFEDEFQKEVKEFNEIADELCKQLRLTYYWLKIKNTPKSFIKFFIRIFIPR